MSGRLFVLSVCVVGLAFGLSSCATDAQVTQHQGQILFDSGNPEALDIQIYVINPDGSHVEQLTETPPGKGNGNPVVSKNSNGPT